MKKEEILSFLSQHKELLRKRFFVTKIALFGSYARDEANEQSDIDILIEIENAQDVYKVKSQLRTFLQNSFHKKVDLAREKYLKPYAKSSILKDALYV